MQRPIVQPIVQPIVKSVVNGGLFGAPGEALYIDFVNRHAEANGAFADFNSITSFTRASTKYAQDSNGVYQEFAANSPAITDNGLLIEPAVTNLSPYSSDFTNWLSTNLTVTPNAVIAPNGLQTGDTLTDDAVDAAHNVKSPAAGFISVASGTKYCASVYVKSGSFSDCFLRIDQDVGDAYVSRVNLAAETHVSVIGSPDEVGILELSDGWYRVWTVFTTNASATEINPHIHIGDRYGAYVGVGDNIHAWGFQFEEGDTPTSFIETTGSSATRNADDIDIELPSGTHDLVFTFDDGSTQTVSGQSGTYSIPTDLDRPFVRSLQTQ